MSSVSLRPILSNHIFRKTTLCHKPNFLRYWRRAPPGTSHWEIWKDFYDKSRWWIVWGLFTIFFGQSNENVERREEGQESVVKRSLSRYYHSSLYLMYSQDNEAPAIAVSIKDYYPSTFLFKLKLQNFFKMEHALGKQKLPAVFTETNQHKNFRMRYSRKRCRETM